MLLSGARFPAAVLVTGLDSHTDEPQVYPFDEKAAFTAQFLTRSVDAFFAGRLAPHRATQRKAPTAIEIEAAAPVRILTGATYDSSILRAADTGVDAVIEFFSPSCGGCKLIEPAYQELATVLEPVANISVFRLDASANGWDKARFPVDGFPTIYYMRAAVAGVGSANATLAPLEKPVVFSGTNHSIARLLQFVKKNASPALSEQLRTVQTIAEHADSIERHLRQRQYQTSTAADSSDQKESEEFERSVERLVVAYRRQAAALRAATEYAAEHALHHHHDHEHGHDHDDHDHDGQHDHQHPHHGDSAAGAERDQSATQRSREHDEL